MNKNDLRVIKTRINIETSFIYLLSQNNIHTITVQNILDKALINRSTFYKHYSDKYQVAEVLCASILEMFTKCVEERFCYSNPTDIKVTCEHLYQILSEKNSEILILFKIQTDTVHLYDNMNLYLKTRFYQQYENKGIYNKEMLGYLSTLYASLVMTSIKWCLENNDYKQLLCHVDKFLKLTEIFQL